MKTVLAYGDSLTYGTDPAGGRHPFEDRWPSVLEKALEGRARVIAEGLGGRTTAYDDWVANADRNGARILPTLLASHSPLDLVIVMLGTNDLKPFIAGTAAFAARGARRLIEIVRGHFAGAGETVPQILLVSPPHAVETSNEIMPGYFGAADNLLRESRDFSRHYRRHADETGVAFFDAATVAAADPLDGVHLNAANTRAIGEALAPVVRELLGLQPIDKR